MAKIELCNVFLLQKDSLSPKKAATEINGLFNQCALRKSHTCPCVTRVWTFSIYRNSREVKQMCVGGLLTQVRDYMYVLIAKVM